MQGRGLQSPRPLFYDMKSDWITILQAESNAEPFRGKKEIAHSDVPLTMFRVSPSAALIVC